MTPEEKITCNLSLKPMHLSQLASAIGCSEMKTAKILREMRQADEVRDMGYGRYELIPDFPKGGRMKKQIILAAALFTVAGLAMESAGITDTLAYALMGYLVGFLGWAR